MDLDTCNLNVNTTSRQPFLWDVVIRYDVLMSVPQLQMGFDKQIVEQKKEITS